MGPSVLIRGQRRVEQVGLQVVGCRWVLANTVSCTCPLSRGVTTVFKRGACGMFLILSGSLLDITEDVFWLPLVTIKVKLILTPELCAHWCSPPKVP